MKIVKTVKLRDLTGMVNTLWLSEVSKRIDTSVLSWQEFENIVPVEIGLLQTSLFSDSQHYFMISCTLITPPPW